MKINTESKWQKGLVGLAGLALSFNFAACQKQDAEPITAPELPSTSETMPTIAEGITQNLAFTAAGCNRAVLPPPALQPVLKRELTKNEIVFYKKLYGNALNINGVCIYLYETPPIANVATDVAEGDTNVIRVYGQKYYSEDYSQEKDPFLFGALAYEMMHLIQHQQSTHKNQPDASVSSKYPTLFGELNMNLYSDSQQRALMEDYVRFIFHPTGETKQLIQNYGSGNCPAQDILTKTVESMFPNARELRHAHQSRHLADNEKALVLGLFGEQIKLVNEIEVNMHARCDGDVAGSVLAYSKTEFHTWTRERHENDYTRGSLFNFGLFPHEITHIWQNQTNYRYTGGNSTDYNYPINTEKWEFKDYYDEQQGAIIEDYVRYFLHKKKGTRSLNHTTSNLQGLKKIVEEQFPTARRTREYFEEHGQLPDLKTVQSWLKPMAENIKVSMLKQHP